MKGLYDIFKYVFLRFLREFEKWSLLGKIGKNEEKLGKMTDPESANIHYLCSMSFSKIRRSDQYICP